MSTLFCGGEQENISVCLYKLQEGIFGTQLVQI